LDKVGYSRARKGDDGMVYVLLDPLRYDQSLLVRRLGNEVPLLREEPTRKKAFLMSTVEEEPRPATEGAREPSRARREPWHKRWFG
jgi:hypothetical protein